MDNSKFLYKNKIKNRIFEIDLFRGIAVLFMIFDHLVYNFWDVLPMFFSAVEKGNVEILDEVLDLMKKVKSAVLHRRNLHRFSSKHSVLSRLRISSLHSR